MSTFRIGQKVVCVNGNLGAVSGSQDIVAPKKGEVVTVAGYCSIHTGNIDIVEYLKTKYGKLQSFRSNIFRPLTEHSASVSIEVIQSLPLTVKETIDTPQTETV